MLCGLPGWCSATGRRTGPRNLYELISRLVISYQNLTWLCNKLQSVFSCLSQEFWWCFEKFPWQIGWFCSYLLPRQALAEKKHNQIWRTIGWALLYITHGFSFYFPFGLSQSMKSIFRKGGRSNLHDWEMRERLQLCERFRFAGRVTTSFSTFQSNRRRGER